MGETTADESLTWVKSTRSAANGDCVEISRTAGGVAVRDSKDPQGPVLKFSTGAWQGFIDGIQAGDFNRPGAS